ncbi:hypothetical protein OXYTRIMIC_311 [Oxytricha trifallax]|uniref:NrS-1 polymerase-like helicase domain-containing protein n=1 Tax=Oxytricha trifallax TaxID=1172189 RepID=A0A073I029_9SPIT|nr:hypothetical protein OXYTRIMIC_311 [Oxytricha trifallax]
MEKKNQQVGEKPNERHYFVLEIDTDQAKDIHTQVVEAMSKATTRFSHALIIQSTAENKTRQYLTIHLKQDGLGLTKNYFSKSEYLGHQKLTSLQLSYSVVGKVQIRKLFANKDQLTLQCGDTEHFRAFIDFLKLQARNQESRQSSARTSSKTQDRISGTFKELYRTQQINSVANMYEKYQDDSEMCEKIVRNHKTLATYQSFEQQIISRPTPKQTKFQSLVGFLQRVDTQSPHLQKLDKSLLQEMQYYDIVDKLYRVIFRKCQDKINVVWLYGHPNTGKTTIAKYLRKIFITEDFRILNRSFCVDPCKSISEQQIVIMDEIKMDLIYDTEKIDDLKRFFEGEGYPVNLKYKSPVVRFEKCQVIAISNQLPLDRMNELDQKSFEARMMKAEFTGSMQRQDEKFPFNEVELAIYFQQRLIEDGDSDLLVDEPTVAENTYVEEEAAKPK